MTASPPPLRLRPSLLVPGEQALHVVTRRGHFVLHGRDVPRLHERLGPYLRGSHGQDDLLAAVAPEQRAALVAYFDRLRAAGALDDGGALPEDGRASDAAVVSLRGPPPPDALAHPLCLCFVTPEQAGRLLLNLRTPVDLAGRLTLVCVEGEAKPSPATPCRREAYARWLLRDEVAVAAAGRHLRVYRLDERRATLERLAAVGGGEALPLRTLPVQLDVVRREEVEQAPLAVARAEHPFFPLAVRGAGVSYAALSAHLRRAWLGRLLLDAAHRPLEGRVGLPGGPWRPPAPGRPPPPDASASAVARSRLHLHLELLERWAALRMEDAPPMRLRTEDLLRDGSADPTTEYLRAVLRLRRSRLEARVATTPDGLFVCTSGEHRAVSLIRARAVAKVLLAAVWEEFHDRPVPGDAPPELPCDPLEFTTRTALRRLVAELAGALRAQSDGVRFFEARLRCWGSTLWVGHLLGGRAG